MRDVIKHFDALTNIGLKVIPLYENTKKPLCKGWNKNWNLHKNRNKLLEFPNSNIGVLLGEILDIEGDSEEANNIIKNIVKDYPHPTYQSKKSIHHLFINPDKSLTRFEWNKIEFRGNGHQSALPPSKIKDVSYKWFANFKFPIPEMPEELLDFYKSKRYGNKEALRNHSKVTCINCFEKQLIHNKRLKIELKAFNLLGEKWQCHKCRKFDLREASRLIRGKAPNFLICQSIFQLQ